MTYLGPIYLTNFNNNHPKKLHSDFNNKKEKPIEQDIIREEQRKV